MITHTQSIVTVFMHYIESKFKTSVFFFTVYRLQIEEDFWLVHLTTGYLNETCFSIGPHQVPGVPASERNRRQRIVGGACGDAPLESSAASAVRTARVIRCHIRRVQDCERGTMASLSPFGRSSKDIMNVMQRLQGRWCCISALHLSWPLSGTVSQAEFCWFRAFRPGVLPDVVWIGTETPHVWSRRTHLLNKSILMVYRMILCMHAHSIVFSVMLASQNCGIDLR